MKLKIKLICIAALFAGGCVHNPKLAPDKAGPELLIVEGFSDFDAGNLAASSSRAVLDAKKKAVLRTAQLYMDETSVVERMSELEAEIAKNMQIYVDRYEILSEGQDGPYYRVRLKAWVYNSKIAAGLRALNLSGVTAYGLRAALVQKGASEAAFAAAFKDAFSRHSVATVGDYAFTGDAALAAGPEAQLLAAAVAAGADLLITISASVAPSGAGINTGFYPSRAKAAAKVYDAASGKELLELSTQADAIDSFQQVSFSKALASAGESLAQETAVKAERVLKQAAPLKLIVAGLDGIETLERLKKQLLRLDVKGLRLESYVSGTAVFEVVPRRPDPQELASAVLRGDSMRLELDGAGERGVAFTVQK